MSFYQALTILILCTCRRSRIPTSARSASSSTPRRTPCRACSAAATPSASLASARCSRRCSPPATPRCYNATVYPLICACALGVPAGDTTGRVDTGVPELPGALRGGARESGGAADVLRPAGLVRIHEYARQEHNNYFCRTKDNLWGPHRVSLYQFLSLVMIRYMTLSISA